jgi:molybdopterin synthase sulfur carrier subunit
VSGPAQGVAGPAGPATSRCAAARVVVTPAIARAFCGGMIEHDVEGREIRHLVRALDTRFPGIAMRLEEGCAVAIDGVIHQNAWFETVPPGAEVCFIPAIEGG